jgi:hypothetical protein
MVRGMWVTQRQVEREGGAVQGEHRTKARFGKERDGEEEGEGETAEV